EPRTGEPPALPTTEHPPPASAPPLAAGEPATATTATTTAVAPDESYSAGAYSGPDTPDGTEEFYEHEGYEDYAEEFPAAGARHGDEPGEGPGEDARQPGSGEAGNGSSPGPTMPVSAPAGAFDRMHSSPTRPED